jgi:hypothetical protein
MLFWLNWFILAYIRFFIINFIKISVQNIEEIFMFLIFIFVKIFPSSKINVGSNLFFNSIQINIIKFPSSWIFDFFRSVLGCNILAWLIIFKCHMVG